MVDVTAPGRFVETVQHKCSRSRMPWIRTGRAPPAHGIRVETELFLHGSSSPSPPPLGVKVRAVLSPVSSSPLSLLLKHIFQAAWCCAMCFFHCWMMMMSLCRSRDFSFPADMHNSVVRINGLLGFGRVCKPDAGSSLLSPV